MSPDGPMPPDQLDEQLNFLPGVIFDFPGVGKQFGDVIVDANPSYVAVSIFVCLQSRLFFILKFYHLSLFIQNKKQRKAYHTKVMFCNNSLI